MPLIDDYKKEECILGVIYNMSPSAEFPHASVNGNIHAALHNQLKNSLCKVFMENADLYMDETNNEYVIPDIMLVCDTKAFKKGTRKYYGIPKLVVETLSPSTARKDRTVKKDLYARKGIGEFWIVDYRSKSIEIYYLEENNYVLNNALMLEDDPEDEYYNAKEVISLREIPNVSLILEDIFDKIDY